MNHLLLFVYFGNMPRNFKIRQTMRTGKIQWMKKNDTEGGSETHSFTRTTEPFEELVSRTAHAH